MKKSKEITWINSLLSELSDNVNDQNIQLIQNCGRECAKSQDLVSGAIKIREEASDKNDVDYLFKKFKEECYNTPRLYKKGDLIYLEYHECCCPMVKDGVNNSSLCNCTVGYTKEIYETLFDKSIEVKLLQSILKGDSICKQRISLI